MVLEKTLEYNELPENQGNLMPRLLLIVDDYTDLVYNYQKQIVFRFIMPELSGVATGCLFIAYSKSIGGSIFTSGGQSIGAAASASVLPMNIQG